MINYANTNTKKNKNDNKNKNRNDNKNDNKNKNKSKNDEVVIINKLLQASQKTDASDYLPTRLPTYSPTYLLTYLPANSLTHSGISFRLIHLSTDQLTCHIRIV